MSLRPSEIASLLTQHSNPLEGMDRLRTTLSGIAARDQQQRQFDASMKAQQEQSAIKGQLAMAEVARKRSKDYADMLDKRADNIREDERLSAAEKKRKADAVLAVKKVILQDPQMAEAYMAAQGMLSEQSTPATVETMQPQQAEGGMQNTPQGGMIQPGQIQQPMPYVTQQQQQAAPVTMQPKQLGRNITPKQSAMLGLLGVDQGYGPININAGGKQFTLDPEVNLAQRGNEVVELFSKNAGAVPPEKQPIAEMIADMGPEAVKVMSGDKEKAANYLKDRYDEASNEYDKAKKKTLGAGKKFGGDFDADDYAKYESMHFRVLGKDADYNKELELLRQISKAEAFLKSGNPAQIWTGVRYMLTLQGEGSRPSDFDVRMAQGFKSKLQELKDMLSTGTTGELSKETIDNMVQGLRDGASISHIHLKEIYDRSMETYKQSPDPNERRALNTVIGSFFNKPYFSWYKAPVDVFLTPDEGEVISSGGVDKAKGGNDAERELEELVLENENLLEQ